MIQVKDGKIVKRNLPQTGTLSDGRTVSGYDQLSADILKAEGWLPVEEIKPTFNPATEQLTGPAEEIKADKITQTWTVEQKPAEPEPEPRIDSIILNADKTTIMANGIDAATITASFEGTATDALNCYICINGETAEIVYPIESDQVTREFVTSTAGVFKLDFYAGDQVKTIFVEAT